jgi:hypothetical protein
MQRLIRRGEACVAATATAADAEAALCALVDGTQPLTPVTQPTAELVVASCVGAWLHVGALTAITRRYAACFPDSAPLDASPAWTDAMLRLSWRMQDALLAHALARVTDDGRVYVAEPVQAGVVYARSDGAWRTPGWYRVTRRRFLAELLPPGAVLVDSARWMHVATAPSPEAPGLVYNVHAVVLARAP